MDAGDPEPSVDPDRGDVRERCPTCDRETPHDVTISIEAESDEAANAEFSREPYRVAECLHCGGVVKTRMNDA